MKTREECYSEEKHEPVSDIDTVAVDSQKALDPEWPIREADISGAAHRPRGAMITTRVDPAAGRPPPPGDHGIAVRCALQGRGMQRVRCAQ